MNVTLEATVIATVRGRVTARRAAGRRATFSGELAAIVVECEGNYVRLRHEDRQDLAVIQAFAEVIRRVAAVARVRDAADAIVRAAHRLAARRARPGG